MNKLGVYIHIPYCIQRCGYCDFATYEQSQILPPSDYIDLVLKEIQLKHLFFQPQKLASIYFGGGTPSLITPELLEKILKQLQALGFDYDASTEVTLEINPATLTQVKIKQYLDFGINRFSVGSQTFNDQHLKYLGREHDVQDTLSTLELLSQFNTNFSLDILFALPNQTQKEIERDLNQALALNPSHISAYCLTLNEGHPLNKNRPLDDDQIEMFHFLRTQLIENKFFQYEISNYSRPGKESQHNLLYWTDQEYWGLGLSAHSYSKSTPFGLRFWNDKKIQQYERHIKNLHKLSHPEMLSTRNWENLKEHEALTDFCHTSLRINQGLSLENLVKKFSPAAAESILKISKPLLQKGLLQKNNNSLQLSPRGQIVSNQVFEEFTFLGLTS